VNARRPWEAARATSSSAAALWLAAGLPLVYVQRQLGHADIATTVKHYGHLEPAYLKDAAARAESAIWSA
jgi:integrase